MTITPEAPTLNAPVDVRFTAAGTPLAVRYDGRIWAVAAEPVHWFTGSSRFVGKWIPGMSVMPPSGRHFSRE